MADPVPVTAKKLFYRLHVHHRREAIAEFRRPNNYVGQVLLTCDFGSVEIHCIFRQTIIGNVLLAMIAGPGWKITNQDGRLIADGDDVALTRDLTLLKLSGFPI